MLDWDTVIVAGSRTPSGSCGVAEVEVSGIDVAAMMREAIAAMRQSVDEPRDDGKASPKVGAVLAFPGGRFVAAWRGELRDGEHAEYALLERKCRDEPVEDATLFVTLEPCAPGSRHPPKRGCCEWIASARIKTVYVGIGDPDPKVDRKGIQYLQDRGVDVQIFPAELQEEIRDANREFIDQALERAAEAEEAEARPIKLSPLEDATEGSDTGDLSKSALEKYRDRAELSFAVGSADFSRRLVSLGLIENTIPTGFGLLLFGKEPRLRMQQAGMLGTIHYSSGGEETKDFDGPQVLVPEEALAWLRDKIPNPVNRTEAVREPQHRLLFELVREGVVNALVHRDYEIEGAKCQLVVTDDTIVIKSPGLPQRPVTLKQLQDFSASALSRNPILHYVFAQMKLAEERGLGLKSLKARAEELGLPRPAYTWHAPYLVLTLYRSPESASRSLDAKVRDALSADELSGWERLTRLEVVTAPKYADAVGLDIRTAQRHLRHFTELGLLRRVGKGRATRYEIIR